MIERFTEIGVIPLEHLHIKLQIVIPPEHLHIKLQIVIPPEHLHIKLQIHEIMNPEK